MSRRAANVLIAACVWTLYVWVTRMWNIAQDDDHDTAFKVVHGVLALVSVGFGIAVGVIGWRARRAQGADTSARNDGLTRSAAEQRS
jgi:hypothetical protein